MAEQRKKAGATRCALVTGGAKGIGAAICERLAADGMRVAVADIDFEAAQTRADELGASHKALAVDLTDPEAAYALPAEAADALGGLDVVINNAGMTDSTGKSLVDLPAESFHRLVALNLTAVERICASALGRLGPAANIVNLASGASYRPLALRGPYSATKAGVAELTRALAPECRSRGINVAAIAPGYTLTPLVEELHQAGRVDLDKVAASIPLGRLAAPADIAAAVAFAASADAGVINGQTLLVDGGGSMGPPSPGTAPARGTETTGCLVVIGAKGTVDLDPRESLEFVEDISALERMGSIRAVIDAQALSVENGMAKPLENVRATALACAALERRTRDFSLLFLSRRAESPGARAGVAAGEMLARTLALEWAPAGIRINAVSAEPAEPGLGALCRFLSGSDAAYLTGQVIQAGDGA